MNRSLDPSAFSRDFSSRILTESDIPAILSLIKTNPQYEKSCGVSASEVSIREDLTLLPPGKTAADKFFLGFFQEEELIALTDLILAYPDPGTAYLGLFMVKGNRSKKGIGTSLFGELCASLKTAGFQTICLAFQRDNPQSSHFWKKQGFIPIKEVSHPYGAMILAEKAL